VKAKNVFIAATGQNDGKTTISLGLIGAFGERVKKIGFMKPVGQRYVDTPRGRFDEDAVLIDEVCDLRCDLEDMSPVTIGRGFTRDYILGRKPHHLEQAIVDAYVKVSADAELVVIEGTGHAGVGSVVDLSNAHVAKLLDAPVLIVATGGIGRPIDEIALNAEFFRRQGVRILGVVLNRVMPEKVETVNTVTRKGLERMAIRLLGVVPNEPLLAVPTMGEILHETGGQLINGDASLGNHVGKIVVGAMMPHQFLNYCERDILVITSGDREDLILAALSCCQSGPGKANCVSGMVLTGGITPHENILNLIRCTDVPVIVVQNDSYRTASRIHDMTAKILPRDKEKIAMVRTLVRNSVDAFDILNSL
jgi:phosphate acetyltransferase